MLSRTRVKTNKGQIYALKFQCPLNMAGYFSSLEGGVGGGAFFFKINMS